MILNNDRDIILLGVFRKLAKAVSCKLLLLLKTALSDGSMSI